MDTPEDTLGESENFITAYFDTLNHNFSLNDFPSGFGVESEFS